MKYKGYYIENSVNGFCSKEEIDEFLKYQAIERYKTLAKMFFKNSSVELSIMMGYYADKLHKDFGLSYEEIEAIEIETFDKCANS